MQYRYWDYTEIDSTEYMNDVIRTLLRLQNIGPSGSPQPRSGRLTGFLAVNTPNDNKVDLSRGGYDISALISAPGALVLEDTDLDDPVTFSNVDSANPRIDLVVMRYEYRDYLPAIAATYEVIKGTSSAAPVPNYAGVLSTDVALSEIYIDPAPGVGNPPVIAQAHIKAAPTCLAQLFADHEPTYGRTDNYNGDAGSWLSLGSNTDKFYVMRDPDDDKQTLLLVNAYYDPSDATWHQQDASRRSLLLMLNVNSPASETVFAVYKADAGTVGAVFASFWSELFDLDEAGLVTYANSLTDYAAALIENGDVTQITGANASYPAVGETASGRVLMVYRDSSSFIQCVRTSARGISFGSPIAVYVAAAASAPDLVHITGETMLAVFMGSTVANTPVYAYQTADGGATWALLSTVFTAGDAINSSYKPSVVKLSNGDLLAFALSTVTDGNDKFVVKTSVDNGATWGARSTVYTGGGNSLTYPEVTVHPTEDYITLAYIDITAGQTWCLYSTNGGASWVGPVVVEPTAPIAGPYPSTYALWYQALTKELYCFFRDVSGTGNVYYRISTDYGATWGPATFWHQPLGGGSTLNSFDIWQSQFGVIFEAYFSNTTSNSYYNTGYTPIIALGPLGY